MRYVLLLIIAFIAVAEAAARQSDDGVSKNTYVLIDSSGSMRRHLPELEREVSNLRQHLLSNDQNALASFTYFRAADGAACWAGIPISDPQRASDFALEIPIFFIDHTPLGGALAAALQHAGDRPADIFILSDEEQTPGCGPDICEVAQSNLPREGVTVKSIPIGADAKDRDRLGCIDAIQSNPSSALSAPNNSKPSGDQLSRTISRETQSIGVFEKWLWLIGFLLVAVWAIVVGLLNAKAATRTESMTQDIQSVRRLVVVEGNEQAETRLRELVEKYNKDETGSDETRKKKPKRNLWASFIFWLPLGMAGAIFLAITFVPPETEFRGFRFEVAQRSAWTVLASNFATAFAILWVSTIFFAANEYRRRSLAQHDYAIAANEANWTERSRKAKMIEVAQANYLKQRDAIRALRFKPPWHSVSNFKSVRIIDNIDAQFEELCDRAKDLALGTCLDASCSTEQSLYTEIDRLKFFLPSSSWGTPKVELATFVQTLLQQNRISEEEIEAWSALHAALRDRRADLIKQAVRRVVRQFDNH